MLVLKFLLRFIGNFYWKVFGGLILAILWLAIGLFFIVTIYFYNEGIQCIKIAYITYKPFGKKITFYVSNPILSSIWVFSFGIAIGIVTVVYAIASFATLGGFLMIKQWIKVFQVSVFPFCYRINMFA